MAGHEHAQRLLHGAVGGPTDTYVPPKVYQHQFTHPWPLWMHCNGQKSRLASKLVSYRIPLVNWTLFRLY